MGTAIEWTDETWNPLVGCTEVSPGCRNCYAAVMANRLAAMAEADIAAGRDPGRKRHYIGTTTKRGGKIVWTGKVNLAPEALAEPLKWSKPRQVFVNSMSDLFHKDVPFEYVDKVFAVMASCGRHTFQVLTKRPDRMAEYLTRVSKLGPDHANLYRSALIDFYQRHDVDLTRPYQVPQSPTPELRFIYDSAAGVDPQTRIEDHPHFSLTKSCGENHWREWPLSNVWLGTSVENQEQADKRIPHLLQVPAAVRFLSCEPMLGAIDLSKWLTPANPLFICQKCGEEYGDGEETSQGRSPCCLAQGDPNGSTEPDNGGIGWVIVGGESGHEARPMHPDWARSLRNQCVAAGVPYFFKQFGEWLPQDHRPFQPTDYGFLFRDGRFVSELDDTTTAREICGMGRVGKKAAGRILDGRTWDEFPQVA